MNPQPERTAREALDDVMFADLMDRMRQVAMPWNGKERRDVAGDFRPEQDEAA